MSITCKFGVKIFVNKGAEGEIGLDLISVAVTLSHPLLYRAIFGKHAPWGGTEFRVNVNATNVPDDSRVRGRGCIPAVKLCSDLDGGEIR